MGYKWASQTTYSCSLDTQLMEKCVERSNMQLAWKNVERNGGAAGVDARSVEETKEMLKQSWPKIKSQLLQGNYRPRAVRRVEIPKDGVGMRQLGIPTALDRLIQQALLQVLQPMWDPTFHENSYGFRPKRSAHQAVREAKRLIEEEGRVWCVDCDLEKFFDRVNHDMLMDRVCRRISDQRVIELIRRYLKAGVMVNGVVNVSDEGSPQGGPLSPLLSNLLLNDIDWELHKRGIKFVRYADDQNLYLGSEVAAKKAMETLRKLVGRLKLKINEEKSKIRSVLSPSLKFLGFSYKREPKTKDRVQIRISSKAKEKFKKKVKALTSRNIGKSMEKIVERLNTYTMGWKGYFKLSNTPSVLNSLDSWIRHRLRTIQLKQWKRGKTCYRELVSRGLDPVLAAQTAKHCRSWWRTSRCEGMHRVFTNAYFQEIGYESLTT